MVAYKQKKISGKLDWTRANRFGTNRTLLTKAVMLEGHVVGWAVEEWQKRNKLKQTLNVNGHISTHKPQLLGHPEIKR